MRVAVSTSRRAVASSDVPLPRVVVDLKVGELLEVGGALVRLVHKSGQLARLAVSAPSNVSVQKLRGE